MKYYINVFNYDDHDLRKCLKLPYANNALEPVISQQTIDFHYGKHLQKRM